MGELPIPNLYVILIVWYNENDFKKYVGDLNGWRIFCYCTSSISMFFLCM